MRRLPKAEFLRVQAYVIENIDMISFLEEYGIQVDRVGALNTAVCCPFHDTNTSDSARVNAKNGQRFYCNNPTCKVHGKKGLDIIALYQELLALKGETVSYIEAMLDLYCNRLQQEMPKFEDAVEEEIDAVEQEKRANLRLLFLHTTDIAEKLLADPQLGVEGRKYLDQRKISPAFRKAYHIGFIPSGYKLSEELIKRKFTKEFLTEVGFISKNTGNDTLFNRLIIPMWNEKYDVLDPEFDFINSIAENLYTRTVIIKNDRDKAYKHRYINQSLPFFNIKSCFGKKSIILVEGIIDCLSIQDAIIKMKASNISPEQFPNVDSVDNVGVAATYGTNGLTTEKMKKYLGSFSTIYLAADNDANNAGQTANIKRAEILRKLFPKTNIKLVTWKAKDANDMLVSGAKPIDFWECLNNAISPEEFALINTCRILNQKSGITDVFSMINELQPILNGIDCSNPLKVASFAKFVEKQTHIPYDAIIFSMLSAKLTTTEALAIITELEKNES